MTHFGCPIHRGFIAMGGVVGGLWWVWDVARCGVCATPPMREMPRMNGAPELCWWATRPYHVLLWVWARRQKLVQHGRCASRFVKFLNTVPTRLFGKDLRRIVRHQSRYEIIDCYARQSAFLVTVSTEGLNSRAVVLLLEN